MRLYIVLLVCLSSALADSEGSQLPFKSKSQWDPDDELPGATYTPLHKGDIIAIHSSAYRSDNKYPGIPLMQTSPPTCRAPKDPWYRDKIGTRVRTNSDRSSVFTAFRRGTNSTLGDILLGQNYRVTPFFLKVGEDMRHMKACTMHVAHGTDLPDDSGTEGMRPISTRPTDYDCIRTKELGEKRYRFVWYLDGVPSLYNKRSMAEAVETEEDDDTTVANTRDIELDSRDVYEVGVPVIPYVQFEAHDKVNVWTHFDIVVYYRHHTTHGSEPLDWYEVVGFEVQPRDYKTMVCEPWGVDSQDVTYSVKWISSSSSWSSRIALYQYHGSHKDQINIMAISGSVVAVILVIVLMSASLRYRIIQDAEHYREVQENATSLDRDIVEYRLLNVKGAVALEYEVFRTPPFPYVWSSVNGIGAQCLATVLALTATGLALANSIESTPSIVEACIWTFCLAGVVNGMVSVYFLRVCHRGLDAEAQYDPFWSRVFSICRMLRVPVSMDAMHRVLATTIWLETVVITGCWMIIQAVLKHEQSTAFLTLGDTLYLLLPLYGLMLLMTYWGGVCAHLFFTHTLFDSKSVTSTPRAIPPLNIVNYQVYMPVALASCSCVSLVVLVSYVFDSIWGTRITAMYTAVSVTGALFLTMATISSCVYLHFQLRWEDWRWWWKAPAVASCAAWFSSLALFLYICVVISLHGVTTYVIIFAKLFLAVAGLSCILFFLGSTACSFMLYYMYRWTKND